MVWDCTEFKMCRDRTSSSLVHLLSLSLVQYNCLNAIVPYPIHMLFREWLKHPVNLRQKFIINSQLTGSEVCTPRLANQLMWHFREKETLCTNFKVIRQISRVLRNFHFQTLCSIKGCTVLSTDFSPIWPIDNLMLLKAQQNSTSYMQQYAKKCKKTISILPHDDVKLFCHIAYKSRDIQIECGRFEFRVYLLLAIKASFWLIATQWLKKINSNLNIKYGQCSCPANAIYCEWQPIFKLKHKKHNAQCTHSHKWWRVWYSHSILFFSSAIP